MAATFSYPHSQDKPLRLFTGEKLKNTNRIKPEALSCLPGGIGCLKIRSPIRWPRAITSQADQFNDGSHSATCGKLRTSDNTAACNKINGHSEAKI